MTLEFDGWPWKTIGHLLYTTSSFVHHFIAISGFELELQPGNAQFGSNQWFFLAVWPSNLTDDLENNRASSSSVYHFSAIGEFKLQLPPGNAQFRSKSMINLSYGLEICQMTFKNNRTPHRRHRHMLIETGVTVRKRLNCGFLGWECTCNRPGPCVGHERNTLSVCLNLLLHVKIMIYCYSTARFHSPQYLVWKIVLCYTT